MEGDANDLDRMSAMQKMQAAAGGKPLGPNGQPSPAQIAAMQVSAVPTQPRLLCPSQGRHTVSSFE
jgi:hypothetical protein